MLELDKVDWKVGPAEKLAVSAQSTAHDSSSLL